MSEDLRQIIIQKILDKCRIKLSLDVNDDYNKAYADGMHDAFNAIVESGVDGLDALQYAIPEIFFEVDEINKKQTKGVVH